MLLTVPATFHGALVAPAAGAMAEALAALWQFAVKRTKRGRR
jgi:hypothetical protein